MKISQEIIQKIPILYDELGSMKAVAETLHISASTVSKYLKATETCKKTFNNIQERNDEINRRYKEGVFAPQIAKQLNISVTTVYSALNEENRKKQDNEYKARDTLYYYIIRLFGIENSDYPVSQQNLTLMNRLRRQGISYSEQYLTLKYYYDITKHPVRQEYHTIGIIPYIYNQAKSYYLLQQDKRKQIEEQMEIQLQQDRKEFNIKPQYSKKRKKKKIDLSELIENDTD